MVQRGVNFAAAGSCTWVGTAGLALVILAAGCGRPIRSMPADEALASRWTTALGDVLRAPFSGEAVPDREPEEVWVAEVGRGLLAAPIPAGPAVLVGTANRMVAALSAETGEHYWERRLDGAVSGGPVLLGDRIYAAVEKKEGKLYALRLERGSGEWERGIGSSPFPPLLVGDAVYVATEGGNVFAVDARDGEELWRLGLRSSAAATPVPHDEGLVVATRADTLYYLNRILGTVRNRAPLPAGVSAPPALRGDTLYVPLHSGELATYLLPGPEALGRHALGAPVLAAPVVAPDGSVYALTSSADVWRIGPAGAERIASLGGASRGSLTLARNGLLVGRLDGTLVFLRPDGTEVWRKKFDDSVAAPVAVAGGAIYVPLLRGKVVKLR